MTMQDKLKLMEFFCAQTVKRHGTTAFTLDAQARALWIAYPFPGNVRELKNIVIRLLAKHAGYAVTAEELGQEFENGAFVLPNPIDLGDTLDPAAEIAANAQFNLTQRLAEIELRFLDAAIAHTDGNMSHAARVLGLSRSTLYSRIEALRPDLNAIKADQ